MINKKGIWFVTLFSMILVLSVYYVSIKDNIFSDLKLNDAEVTIKETSPLAQLRIQNEEDVLKEIEELQTILLNEESTLEEKNNAYESIQTINTNKGLEKELENLIKQEYNLDAFVKINKDHVNVVISSKEHDLKMANNIMNLIQKKYNFKIYVTVKFQN